MLQKSLAITLRSGKGFADVVYLPMRNASRPALLVKPKWKKSARSAIAQIKERDYMTRVKGYTGKILLVGINYDKSKGHECVIEDIQWSKNASCIKVKYKFSGDRKSVV